jgi:hypothetical protein
MRKYRLKEGLSSDFLLMKRRMMRNNGRPSAMKKKTGRKKPRLQIK